MLTAIQDLTIREVMNKVLDVIDNTPLISNIRKQFYKKMLTSRKELILDRSYEILMELPDIKENIDLYFMRCNK